MSFDEESSSSLDEEKFIESKGDTYDIETTGLSETMGLDGKIERQINDQKPVNVPQTKPVIDESSVKTERPLGAEKNRVLQEQEKISSRIRPILKTKSRKLSNKSKSKEQEELSHKLYNQLIKKLRSNKTHDTMKRIEKQLMQIDKISTSSKQQEKVVKQLLVQVGIMKKRLDRINDAISRYKNMSNTSSKNIRSAPKKARKRAK
jgi:hypothetical protein